MKRCQTISGGEFPSKVTGNAKPTVVAFGSHRCGHCLVMAKAVEAAAEAAGGGVELFSVDTNDYPELTERMGVMASPTFIYFRNGREIARAAGAITRRDLEDALTRLSRSA